jgi:carbon-monoxide dehydrogenase small subunit
MNKLIVNGHDYEVEIAPHETLAHVLRKKLGLTGVRFSCGRGECGACTILMEGKPVPSCMILAMQAEAKEIVTIEGLGTKDNLNPIQQAFIDEHGFQCGFCTPGVILSAKALLDVNPKPTPSEVAVALSGHICRCGSYPQIIRSVLRAAGKLERG